METTMSKNQNTRIELTENQNAASHKHRLGLGVELEKRYTPLVVIAIIAILIGLLLPAI